MTTQTSQLKPNEEDLSLVLGTMQVSRGRSYSTTVNPKVLVNESSHGGHHKDAVRTNSNNDIGKGNTVKRKKSVPAGHSESRY